MKVTLRRASKDDSASVVEVYLASRKHFLGFAPLAHSDEDVVNWITTRLIPSGDVMVAEHEGKIIGMMAISETDEGSWIDQLYLHPDSVGKGIGTDFVNFAKAELKPPIRLYTFQENHASRRFYERNRFRLIELSDGATNEEKCPDALYEYLPE